MNLLLNLNKQHWKVNHFIFKPFSIPPKQSSLLLKMKSQFIPNLQVSDHFAEFFI